MESLWCTADYLIFGLSAGDEGGEHEERLAFWHLGDGHLILSPGTGWANSNSGAGEGSWLRSRLPRWRRARVSERQGTLILTDGPPVLTFWPDKHAYAVRDTVSGSRDRWGRPPDTVEDSCPAQA